MRFGIKNLALILALSIFFVSLPVSASFLPAKTQLTYLLSGVDDAAENTDVLCVVNYNKASGAFTVYQIPRDTYIDGGRINSIFPGLLAKGYSENDALSELCRVISDVFAINIDGYIGITTDVFKRFVDLMGGIYITLDEDVTMKDGDNELVLSKGENRLDSEQALYFIRYRTGYIQADLKRMQMQRIFMRGLYDTALNRLSYRTLVRVALNTKGVITNISPVSLATIVTKKKSHTNPGLTAQTLPGEALLSENGAWYYAINRKECVEMLSRSFNVREDNFDTERRLLGKNENFRKIYYG